MPQGQSLELRQLQPGDSATGFSFGDPAHAPLKRFIRFEALGSSASNVTKTYVFIEPPLKKQPPVVRAFLSLLCSQVTLASGLRPSEHEGLDRYDAYPALKIARLGVDRRYQGLGLGRTLVDFAMSVARDEIMPVAGCRFMLVDSKECSVDFYRGYGFTLIQPLVEEDANGRHFPMYLDLQSLLPGALSAATAIGEASPTTA